MLRVYTKNNPPDFYMLADVYHHSITESGMKKYPEETQYEQFRLAEEDFTTYLRCDFFQRTGAMCAVWQEKYYISAVRIESYRDGVLISGLETRPDCYRCGYAERLLRCVTEYLKQRQVQKIYSHVIASNTPSILLHRKCGFAVDQDHATFLDGSVSTNALTLRYDIK